jgi:hypothetical protein
VLPDRPEPGSVTEPFVEIAPPEPHRAPDDLALELMREHTLLTVLVGRMHETATALERGIVIGRERLQRGLDVHRRFLLEVHYVHAKRIARALGVAGDPEVNARLAECAADHPNGEQFQRETSDLLKNGRVGSNEAKARWMAGLWQAEADRIEDDDAREDDLYRRIHRLIPKPERARLLRALRRFDAHNVDAEIA